VPITLLNLSTGGFLMQSPVPFAVGAIDEFRFASDGAADVIVSARVAHATMVVRDDGPVHVIGVRFVDLDEEQRKAIGRLLYPADPRD
jgi:PilZ domain-containing protein